VLTLTLILTLILTLTLTLTVQAYHEITCMRPWLEQRYSKAKRSVYPCQSCGIFFVRSARATRAFAEGLYGYVVHAADKWDQYIYQLMVMRYLVGLGDDLAPLRYRLLHNPNANPNPNPLP